MTDTEQIATPTDAPPAPKARRAARSSDSGNPGTPNPNFGNRYRLFEDGQGDVRLYEIAKEEGLPPGTLIPIPGIPGFSTIAAAKRFVNNSGDKLQGKQVMVIRGCEIGRVNVQTRTEVRVSWKPRKAVHGPAAKEGAGA